MMEPPQAFVLKAQLRGHEEDVRAFDAPAMQAYCVCKQCAGRCMLRFVCSPTMRGIMTIDALWQVRGLCVCELGPAHKLPRQDS